jgi:multimeric flavodoxin WrbA
MNATLICGSPRENGNTQKLLEFSKEILNKNNIKTELILLSKNKVNPCIACNQCAENKNKKCAFNDDEFNNIFLKLIDSDALIVGTPVYFGSATSQITSFLHKAGYVSRRNSNLLKNKIGAPIVVARRAGQNFTYAQLSFFFTINDMIIPGSSYWNIAFGNSQGDVLKDQEGIDTIMHFSENVANLIKTIR